MIKYLVKPSEHVQLIEIVFQIRLLMHCEQTVRV